MDQILSPVRFVADDHDGHSRCKKTVDRGAQAFSALAVEPSQGLVEDDDVKLAAE